MSYNFRPYNQNEQFLMPLSLYDWVKEDSLARFISDTLDKLEMNGRLTVFYTKYRKDGIGNSAFNPLMMLKVLIYAYCTGVLSSRNISKHLENDIAFRFLGMNSMPNFRTICLFRRQNISNIQSLFDEILELCCAAGMVKLGIVAIDGKKVPANAALASNRTKCGIEKEIKKLLEEAERIDKEEDERYGVDKRGDELPEELRTAAGRQKRLDEALRIIIENEKKSKNKQQQKIEKREKEEAKTGKKKRGRKPKTPDETMELKLKANTTDPDSRIMKNLKGFVQGYNGQVVVDSQNQVIVANHLTQEENDKNQLENMIEKCVETIGKYPDKALLDAGYWKTDAIEKMKKVTDLYVATDKSYELRHKQKNESCPRGRIPASSSPKERMERKLLTKSGKLIYKLRSVIVEPVFGQMISRGLFKLMLRGLKNASGEWALWCATHNILKLWRFTTA